MLINFCNMFWGQISVNRTALADKYTQVLVYISALTLCRNYNCALTILILILLL